MVLKCLILMGTYLVENIVYYKTVLHILPGYL